jgi:hypothetical protein
VARLRRPGLAQFVAIVRALGTSDGGKRGNAGNRPSSDACKARSAAGTGGHGSGRARQAVYLPMIRAVREGSAGARHHRHLSRWELRRMAASAGARSPYLRRRAVPSIPGPLKGSHATVRRAAASCPVHACEDRPPWL